MAAPTPDCNSAPHLVGDPVDTLTGAVTDQKLEFRLVGPLELAWMRHYDSSHHQRSFALGWGHTHGYDRRLRFEGQQLVYEGILGERLMYPLLRADGEQVAMHGHRLVRVTAWRYVLHRHAEPSMAFEFEHPERPARLALLFRGRHQLRFHYDAAGLLEGIVDSLGRRIQAVETADGRLHSLTLLAHADQPDELLVAYRYDDDGNLQSTRNQAGHGYTFSYDDQHRLLSSTGRKGFRFQYSYDEKGRCILAMGEDRLYGVALNFAAPGRQTLVTRPDHGVWRYSFDAAGRLTQIQDALGGVQTFVRDPSGRLVFELDQNQALTQIHYDEAGAPVARITPTGQCIPLPEDINRPDPLDQRVAGNPAEYEYGALPDAAPAALLPTAADLARAELPPSVAALVFVRPPEQPALPASTFTVEPLGALWWPLPVEGRVFNHLGKLIAQQDDFGRERRWEYDASGNMAEYTDFDGSRWLQDTGRWHFLCSRTNPLQAMQRWTYTTSGEVERFTDAGGSISEFRYDKNDHLIEVIRDGVLHDRYLRDAVGNLTGKLAAGGRPLLQLEIGPRNLPLKRTLASGDVHVYSYGDDGRPLSANTLKDRVVLAYDDVGHRVLEKRNGLGVESRYGHRNRLAELVLFGRFILRYDWADASTLVLTDPLGGAHQIRQIGHGLIQRDLSNGTQEFAQRDLLGRCLVKVVRHRSGHLWSRRFHWSGEGELRRVEDSAGIEVQHDYDAAHRLRQRSADSGIERFEFDQADNLLRQPGLDGVVLNGNRLVAANGESFAYNDRQHVALRLTTTGDTQYHYDSRDFLVHIESPAGEWRADYDALGRRSRKSWNGRTLEFYWSGDQMVAEVAADGRLRLYVYADPIALTPMMFIDYASTNADPASGQRYWVFSDQVGAPCLVEDEHGLAVWKARLRPFGHAEVSSPIDLHFNFRLPGHYLDPETGLHYNRFRYYDPILGRYLQSDPWGIAGGANVYAYRTNPLLKADVRGLGEDGGEGCEKPKPDEQGAQEPTGKKKGDGDGLMSSADAEALARKKNAEYRESLNDKVKNGEMSKKDVGPVAATVVDRRTGEAFSAHNDRNGNPPENMHPLVEAKVNEARANPQHPSDPGSHAEVHALNDAVNAREAQRKEQGLPPMTEADMGEFTQVSEWTKGSGDGRMKPGDDAPRCGNCQTCTDGVDNRSGDAPKWPPPYDD